ncbi:MAG: DUF1538 domain-containing protein [Oscillospiraceae bacterium]|nr:DUF1538 domain-containing protein [Oscillospiraceae bacterium]
MLVLSIFLVPLEIGTAVMFFVGAFLLIVGMGMFQLGAEISMEPIGEGIGVEVSKSQNLLLMCLASFVMDMIITIAEPDLQVLSNQVPAIPNMTLIFTVAIGVGIFLTAAVLRIVYRLNLFKMLMVLYAIAIVASFFIPKDFLAIAFDSGGVASGPMTATFLLPLCIGACETLGGNIMTAAFGVVSLVALTPLIAIQIMGLQFKFKLNKMQKGFVAEEASFGLDDIIEF